ncbi:hypothetical protein [Actinomyces qiguomingii]|uniref:hypothetical protein n=1 Tax=Actinomyces qiguomingii TaxID=2057800 RepID=UPI000CA072FB|nr:hypothetical protein [Actinomyces qiguomingii]
MSYKDARGHTVPAGTDQASRQSLLDLSLSIPSIPTCTSASAATQHVTRLAAAGVTASAADPVLVWRTDLQQLVSWDGTAWTICTPGAYAATTVSGAGSWSGSRLWLRRTGILVMCWGVLKPNTGNVPASRVTDVLVVPGGWRPSASVYGTLGFLQLAATLYVHGATPPVAGGAVVEVSHTNGNVHVRSPQTATAIKVSGVWSTA